ncbi:hypothetical protein RD110_18580 [Rhodoferax koreense]|uniref:DNA circulation N-terminal domain-containing protein n=1 Tax=Rhodoferax koreensis TaxID=1842727 RepID=A0A1P8JZ37_9BURK|nr:DNA circularization N-terminal domain-containing protein [Rhodoferax koreense]APW38961.1 hypothetical protein RD110_18580 [Rhodoferax koreense]
MTYLSESLQPASFRGVPFYVDAAGVEVGRRVQVHEYPQRDQPWAEDLGRATRSFTVDAFVVGPGYIADANALIAAAEEEGTGTLVHPWLGTMEVSLRELMRVRFDTAAGRAEVSFSFVEGGELEFPSAQSSTPMLSRMSADSLSFAGASSFASGFAVDGFASFVRDAAALDLNSAFDFIGSLSGVSPLASWASGLGASVGSLVQQLSTPLDFAQSLMDLFDLSPLVASLFGGGDDVAPAYSGSSAASTAGTANGDPMAAMALAIVGVAGNGGAGGVLNAPVPAATATPARRQQVLNTAAINALVRRALLAQAVGISSHVDATVQADAHTVRSAVCAALDAESLVADDTAYNALQAARQAVWADLTARASGGARLVPLTPPQVCSALVIAYDRYEDATRADEIVLRNRLVHPGFVPQKPLQVLSK